MRPGARVHAAGSSGQVTFALVRRERLDLDSFARATGTHPDLVARLVALGLLEAERDTGGRLCFPAAEVATMARIERLRAAFALNYAALGLVLDLLERAEAAEARARELPPPDGGRP